MYICMWVTCPGCHSVAIGGVYIYIYTCVYTQSLYMRGMNIRFGKRVIYIYMHVYIYIYICIYIYACIDRCAHT